MLFSFFQLSSESKGAQGFTPRKNSKVFMNESVVSCSRGYLCKISWSDNTSADLFRSDQIWCLRSNECFCFFFCLRNNLKTYDTRIITRLMGLGRYCKLSPALAHRNWVWNNLGLRTFFKGWFLKLHLLEREYFEMLNIIFWTHLEDRNLVEKDMSVFLYIRSYLRLCKDPLQSSS